MILPINYIENWSYIRQCKQTQIEKYLIREKSTRIDFDFKVGDQVTIKSKSAYKDRTRFKSPYEIFQSTDKCC